MPADICRACIAGLLACLPLICWGLSTDRDQPINIESDRANLREKEGISVFEGNVLMTQGSMKLRGHTMTVYIKDETIDKVILEGNPATFVQRPEKGDAELHAESSRMEYHADDSRIILLGSARVWREDGKEFRSERIIYNFSNNTVNAGDSDTGDRVRITLQPRREQEDNGDDTGE